MNTSRMWSHPVFVRTVGSSYDWAMAHPRFASAVGRLVMSADVGRVFGAIDCVAAMPDGSVVLDVRRWMDAAG